MTILVCGSMAYDTIMVFQEPFRKHILPEQIHILNVCFVVPSMRREFGGCAGNIAYNLKLLGDDPAIMATVGHDFGPYADRLERAGPLAAARPAPRGPVHRPGLHHHGHRGQPDHRVPSRGRWAAPHLNRVAEAPGATLGIVSPDGRDGMLEHARGFAAAGIPYIFDPGQGLPMFSGEELLSMLRGAKALTVNDYEARMFEQKTGKSLPEIAGMVEAVVVTRGARRLDGAHGRSTRRASRPLNRRVWSTPPAAAMPTAPGCCMASRAAGIGASPRAWPR